MLGSGVIYALSVLILFIVTTPTTKGRIVCLPNCFPTSKSTKKDCMTFERTPNCRITNQTHLPESECACLWRSYFRITAPAHHFQDKGIQCLTWAVQHCVTKEKTAGTETKKNDAKTEPEVSSGKIASTERKKNDVKTEDISQKKAELAEYQDVADLLKELDEDVKNLYDVDTEKVSKKEDNPQKSVTNLDGEETGEFYGLLNKKTGILRAAERIADKIDREEDLKDLIGPGFGRNNWWLWKIKDDKFKLIVFLCVLVFAVIFTLLALFCFADGSREKKEIDEKGKRGDLDLDMYKSPTEKSNLLFPSDSMTKLEKKRTHFQKFLEKLRTHRRSTGNELEEFHSKMRRTDYRAKQSTPVRKLKKPGSRFWKPVKRGSKQMVKMGVQTPIYDSVNTQNLSGDEDVLYHRVKSPVFSMNNTYEQPFPVYQNAKRPRDISEYEKRPNDSSYYNALSGEVDSQTISPVPRLIETYEQLSRQQKAQDAIYYNEPSSKQKAQDTIYYNEPSSKQTAQDTIYYNEPSSKQKAQDTIYYNEPSSKHKTQDTIYYNEPSSSRRKYAEVSPRSYESQRSLLKSPIGIKVELPNDIDETQRVGTTAIENEEENEEETKVFDATGVEGGKVEDTTDRNLSLR